MSAAQVYRLGFVLFLFWVPIPLGSNRPVFWVVNAGLVAGLYAVSWRDERQKRDGSSPLRLPLGGAILVLLPLAWTVLQALRVVPGFLQYRLPGAAGSGAISIDPSASLAAAAQYASVALAALLAGRIATRTSRSRLLLMAVVGSGLTVAVYGLLATRLGWSQNLLDDGGTGGNLTSFFVNRNTAATFLDLALVTTLALAMASLELDPPRGWRRAAEWPSRLGPPVLVIGVLGTALLETGSRAGITAGLVGLVAVWALAFRRAAGAAHAALGLGMLVLGAAFLLLGTSAATIVDRLANGDIADDARWTLYRQTLDAIMHRPLLGFGAGTFAEFFPVFHGAGLPSNVVWLEAHNAYLQWAAELGLPVTLAMLAGLLAVVWRCASRAARRSRPMPAAVAATGAAAAVAVHSFFDFSLQIQAVSIVFAVLLSVGYVEASRRRHEGAAAPRPASRARSYELHTVELADV